MTEREEVEAWARELLAQRKDKPWGGCPCEWLPVCPPNSLSDCLYRDLRIAAVILAKEGAQ